jgi:hypothetical protein
MISFLKTRRKALRALLLPLAALALAACDPGAFGGGPRINTSAPVPVALLVPRGGTAGDTVLADNLENAARLAMRDLDGVQIDLRVYATAGDASTAATVAQQAVQEGAKIILGPVYGEAANATGVAVASRNVNVLSFSNNPTIAGGNVFILGPTFQNTADRLVGFAKRNGKDQIVVLHANDVAGQLGLQSVQGAIASNGATFSGKVEYAPSQSSVVSAVPQVRDTVRQSGANALFLTSSTASALPLFSQLLPEAGVRTDEVQFMGLTRWDIPPQTLDLPGVQGGWFALPDPEASAAFEAQYNTAYGSRPHPLAGLAFDGIAAVGALVKSGDSGALTGTSLTQNAGFRGASGIFRLRPDGLNERGLAVATVEDRKVVVLENAPQSFGGFGF